MCILYIYTNPNPPKNGYRLIIASNRDEYYSRPAMGAHLDPKNLIIGGRDMLNGREGGMWLGVSIKKIDECKLRFGALLNVTGEDKKDGAKGRGFLVADYLANEIVFEDYLQQLEESNNNYNSYNLVSVEYRNNSVDVYHQSNTTKKLYKFEGKQVLGFGNSTPEVPLQKVKIGRGKFEKIVRENNDKERRHDLIQNLTELLKCSEKNLPDPELERRAPAEFEELSQIYVKIEIAGYGTRTHSIILLDDQWNLDFIESTMQEPIDIKNPKWKLQILQSRL